jgi:hypothetical protein
MFAFCFFFQDHVLVRFVLREKRVIYKGRSPDLMFYRGFLH